MIGVIDVELNAHNPNFPLEPIFTYRDSPQSFRIRNVPRKIGDWNITNVFVNISYPDNTTITKECVLTGGVYVGTVAGCSTSGSVEDGFVVTANETDEDGTSVTGYVLGVGDSYVKDFDGSVSPVTFRRMYFYETTPTNPKIGDSCFQNGILVVWNGTSWKPSVNTSNYYTKTEVDNSIQSVENEIPTKVSELDNDSGYLTQHQSLSNYYNKTEVDNSIQTVENEIPTKVSELQNDSGYLTQHQSLSNYYTKTEVDNSIQSVENEIPTKVSELDNDTGFITTSSLPTKVSQLQNDSGYLTQHQSLSNYYNKTEVDNAVNQKRDLDDFKVYVEPSFSTSIYVTDNTSGTVYECQPYEEHWICFDMGGSIFEIYGGSTYEALLLDEWGAQYYSDAFSLSAPTYTATITINEKSYTVSSYTTTLATLQNVNSIVTENTSSKRAVDDLKLYVNPSTNHTPIYVDGVECTWNGTSWVNDDSMTCVYPNGDSYTLEENYEQVDFTLSSPTYTTTVSLPYDGEITTVTISSHSGSIATESYVDNVVGNINTILDTINGEEV